MKNIKQVKEKLAKIAIGKVMLKRSVREIDRDRNVYTKKLNDLENEEISLKKCFQLPFKLGGTYKASNEYGNQVCLFVLVQYAPNKMQWICKESGNRYSDNASFALENFGEFLPFDAVNKLLDYQIQNIEYLYGGESNWFVTNGIPN